MSGRPDAEEVLAVVRDALTVVLEVDPARVRRETALVEDLQADSLALVELAEIVETRLAPLADRDFRIDDADLERLRTVGDVVDYAVARL